MHRRVAKVSQFTPELFQGTFGSHLLSRAHRLTSFSKRVHKIPGTTYAAAHVDQAPAPPVSSGTEKDTFKSRMERLHDTASTNLYMEGLPMDINEPTLSALVSPYKIMSSRFFQTRLSVPARVIAFVRSVLEFVPVYASAQSLFLQVGVPHRCGGDHREAAWANGSWMGRHWLQNIRSFRRYKRTAGTQGMS